MGLFQWLLKKVTKAFGRDTDALFYTLLYREILKEIQEITQDEEKSLIVMRELGKNAAYDSCDRHSSIFRIMPGKPDKVLDYFGILWSVVFGMDFAEHNYERIPNDGHVYDDYVLNIQKNPICASYSNDKEDTFDFKRVPDDQDGCSAGLCGMLETVANFILKVKKAEYRIGMQETKCLAKGDDVLQLYCKIYNLEEWKQYIEKEGQKDIFSEDFLEQGEPDLLDKVQDLFSLDKMEQILEEPLENVKDKVADLIREKLNMGPRHFFDYFRNYEDDMIRIVGFLFVHLLNEYGGFVEKFLKNDVLARLAGYLFKHMKEMTLLFIPLDVVHDYHELFVSFLKGLAPEEMIQRIESFSAQEDINLLFEGAQIALEDLGIDFSELKDNIWEELKEDREDELISSDQSVIDKSRERFPKIVNILQEIVMLISEILTLPVRTLISGSHHSVKSAVNSVVSEEEGLYGQIRDRADNIFDEVEELQD
ncbi:MAG: hypothetical protein R6U96_13060 [Promethearchaeia archaeon]